MATPKNNVLPEMSNLRPSTSCRMLLDITKTISRSLDLEEVLNLVMDTLGSLLPYDAAGIYLMDGGEEHPFKSKALRGYQISFDLIDRGSSSVRDSSAPSPRRVTRSSRRT